MTEPALSRPARARLEIPARTYQSWAVSLNLMLAFLRVAALHASRLQLLPDEAQYWSWSRHLAAGYFTKPPLIAWLIAATTGFGGNDEWVVRLGAPLLHAGTAIVLFFVGRALFNPRVGFWSAVLYAMLPGVSFSALIISTDVPLLFCWAVALLALWEVLRGGGWAWAVVLGLAIGLGFLAKYAMGYFLLGAALAVLLGNRAPWRATWRQLLLALVIAAACLAPNLIWNATHGWATVGHTAANANWGQGTRHIVEALAFAGAQFGVFGPILIGTLILRVARWRRDPPGASERYLIAFTLPVLALMIVQSGISRAHANWAAVSYVAGTVLVTGWLDRIGRDWPIRASAALHGILFAGFTLLFAGAVDVRLPKFLDIFHQMRGWAELSLLTRGAVASMPPGTAVAAEDREVMAELDYYLRGRSFPLVMAVGKGPPHNQFELEDAIDARTGAHALLISRWKDRPEILDRFAAHDMLEEWRISAGPGRIRSYYVYDLKGFRND